MSHETDDMEMPCRCDCGNWFDLHDGYCSDKTAGKVICEECYDKEQEDFGLEQEVEELKSYITCSESEIINCKETIAEEEANIKNWIARLKKLGATYP